jgi:hypothetical protein
MSALDIKIRGIRSPIPSGHVIGRLSPGQGDAELIDLATLSGHVAASGQFSGGGASPLPSIPSGDLIGNSTSGAAVAADTTLTALVDRAFGSTQGDILYRNSTAWVPLAPGTAGQVLTTGGAAANPSWATGASSTGANPTATAGDVAVNGTATTFLRSDGAPAIQKGSASLFGLVKVDGTSITAAAGVISGATGANPTGTIGTAAVNGTAATFLRSDGAPAIPQASSSTFGAVKVDGLTITATSGVLSVPAGGPGQGLYAAVMSAPPTSASTGLTTWANQSSAVVSDGTTGLVLHGATSSGVISIRYKAVPTLPYNIDILLESIYSNGAGPGALFGWYDGTKIQCFGLFVGATTTPHLYVLDYATLSSGAGQFAIHYDGLCSSNFQVWLRIRDDNAGNILFQILPGGNKGQAITVYTVAKASGYLSAYSNIFFGINRHSNVIDGMMYSYAQS